MSDPETIFIVLADLLFHPLVTGFLYAALLAAIMSTISSQLLVSSSSLTEDFYRLFLRKDASEKESVLIGRLSVLLVGIVAAVIARNPNSQVLTLVGHAWAGFGAAFGPLMILSLTWRRMSGTGAVAGLVVGALTVIVWISLGWNAASWVDQVSTRSSRASSSPGSQSTSSVSPPSLPASSGRWKRGDATYGASQAPSGLAMSLTRNN